MGGGGPEGAACARWQAEGRRQGARLAQGACVIAGGRRQVATLALHEQSRRDRWTSASAGVLGAKGLCSSLSIGTEMAGGSLAFAAAASHLDLQVSFVSSVYCESGVGNSWDPEVAVSPCARAAHNDSPLSHAR